MMLLLIVGEIMIYDINVVGLWWWW